MRIFLAKQLAPHPVINRLQITSNGNPLHPSQQESGPPTRKTTYTDQNSTQPRKATILAENKKFNKHQIHQGRN
jgi:hypothetical protein